MKKTAKFWFLVILFISQAVFAGQVPNSFTYHGTIYGSDGNSPILAPVAFKFDIYSPNNCLLYEETQTGIDLSQSSGQFFLNVGSGTRSSNDPVFALAKVFANNANPIPVSVNCPNGYTSASADTRYLRVTVTLDGENPTVLSPDLAIGSVANSLVAESIQGLNPSNFIHNQGPVSQVNLQTLTNGSDGSSFHNHDSLYVKKNSQPAFSTVSITGTPANSTDATDKSYVDSLIAGLSSTYMTPSELNSAIVAAQPTGSSVATALSSVMSGAATISSSGTLTLSSSGATAGSYPKVTVNQKGFITAVATLTATDIPAPAGDVVGTYSATRVQGIQGFPVSNAGPGNGQMFQFNSGAWTATDPAVAYAYNLSNSLTSNGYQVMPNGLIIQWGLTSGCNHAVAFPIAFPNAFLNMMGSDSGPANASYGFSSENNSNFYVSCPNAADGARWIAFGI